MKAIFEKVELDAEGIWRTHLDPKSLLRIANPSRQNGKISVLMVSHPYFRESTGTLEFDLLSAALLNLGNSGETVIIDSMETGEDQRAESVETYQPSESGDDLFRERLRELPGELKELGTKLLDRVRQKFPGLLELASQGKFVERPNNFWTIKAQPRVRSFRISVYGRLEEHDTYQSITLERGRSAYYSEFKIDSLAQLEDAIRIIFDAKRLKESR